MHLINAELILTFLKATDQDLKIEKKAPCIRAYKGYEIYY